MFSRAAQTAQRGGQGVVREGEPFPERNGRAAMVDAVREDGHKEIRSKLCIIPVTSREAPMRALPRILLACLFLAGCETLPPAPEVGADLVLSGKIKITQGGETSTSNFRWAQTARGFDAYFWGVMGAGTTRLHGDSETLGVEGRDLQASGPAEEILHEQLGWSLPVELLLSWVRGVPEGSMPVENLLRNADGAVESFEQQGWRLRFEGFDDAGRYRRLNAQGGDVVVLIVVRERGSAAP